MVEKTGTFRSYFYKVERFDEWQQTGTVKNSQRLTFVDASGRMLTNFLPQFTRAVNKQQPVILIYRTGHRSAVLTTHLIEQMGYTHVYNVRNGITRWISDSHPVTR